MAKDKITGADCAGCLAHLRTPDDAARRRHSPEIDDDGWMAGSGSPYTIDADYKILLSKAFRREPDKTQVFCRHERDNPHIRTRLTHTMEVVSATAFMASKLGLNADLARAGAFGHDIGHTPLGHQGEDVISELSGRTFRHETFGVVVAQRVERKGFGLNLTRQTLTAIHRHSRGAGELTVGQDDLPEATIVMYADKMAYTFGDLNDIARCHRPLTDYPDIARLADSFGPNQRTRMRACMEALCRESAEKGFVSFSACDTAQRFADMKRQMYTVYLPLNDERQVQRARLIRAYSIISELETAVDPAVTLALMTDLDVIRLTDCERMAIPAVWRRLSVSEIIPHLREKNIDFADPDLDW